MREIPKGLKLVDGLSLCPCLVPVALYEIALFVSVSDDGFQFLKVLAIPRLQFANDTRDFCWALDFSFQGTVIVD